jgi:hypothetical protein
MRLMKISVVLVALAAVGITGCSRAFQQHLPPAQMLMEPGPGVGGPGPGVMMPQPCGVMPGQVSQVAFVGPEGMRITWDVGAPGQFDSEPLVCPGHYNFPQGAIYRLKLTYIPGRPAVELYPTLEIGPAVPRTEAFLAHNAIPVQFTEEDFDQVLSGNFVTKVIYLPDPEFQGFALAGVETLVSTRLDPGVDPIVEADRRGAILAVVRVGNKDLEIPSQMGETAEEGGVMPTAYQVPVPDEGMAAGARPLGVPVGGPSTMPMNYVSGVNGPQYGMPISGTPIGLPGPPHVPLGVPAGLQKHVVKNHTWVRMPKPTSRLSVDVKQVPGYSYPKPANRAYILEQTFPGLGANCQPLRDREELIAPGGEPCEY